VVFHHDPDHDDDKMDAIGREVAAAMPAPSFAREGILRLTPLTPLLATSKDAVTGAIAALCAHHRVASR
jgi:hypothetical protein